MTKEALHATTTINATPEAVFAVLADPARHVAIDGTGWLRESLDTQALTETGQVFRMAMYHPGHPDRNYEIANRVQLFDPPRAISWAPGQESANDGSIEAGGWIWRYDLRPGSRSETEVTLTYDWSAVSQAVRERVPFPPFSPDHLDNSLSHLAKIVES